MNSPLVDQQYLLQKYPGKGGWTYAAIPEILQDKNSPFGWVKVKGMIDDYALKHCKLMPMGNGLLFLPVKADIRKKIGKQAGDYVHVVLYADYDPVVVPEELIECLQDNPAALKVFSFYPDSKKRSIVEWIYSARKEETRVERMVTLLRQLEEDKRI